MSRKYKNRRSNIHPTVIILTLVLILVAMLIGLTFLASESSAAIAETIVNNDNRVPVAFEMAMQMEQASQNTRDSNNYVPSWIKWVLFIGLLAFALGNFQKASKGITKIISLIKPRNQQPKTVTTQRPLFTLTPQPGQPTEDTRPSLDDVPFM